MKPLGAPSSAPPAEAPTRERAVVRAPARADGVVPSAAAEAARLAAEREDTRLMQAYKKGDADAFGKLLARHRKPVYNFCLRMLGNSAAAEDAMQEVFLRIVRAAKEWESHAKFTTWLYTIARNHCIDALRKANYRKTASLDQPLKAEDEQGATLGDRVSDDESVTPDRGADSARLREKLATALRSLSDEQREVFVMREYAGMPFKDIAEVVGVPENTVKSRMRYALEHLRNQLAAQGVSREDV